VRQADLVLAHFIQALQQIPKVLIAVHPSLAKLKQLKNYLTQALFCARQTPAAAFIAAYQNNIKTV
jgi:hypothetical protein